MLRQAFGRFWHAIHACLVPWLVTLVAYVLIVRGAFAVGTPLGYLIAGVGLLLAEASAQRIWERTRD